MTQHPSLRSSDKSKMHRSVLKRYERLKHMKEKGEWEDDSSIFGMPKIKILKLKIKKEKAVPEEAAVAEGVEGAPVKEGAEGAAAKDGVKKEERAPAKGGGPAKPTKEERGKKQK